MTVISPARTLARTSRVEQVIALGVQYLTEKEPDVLTFNGKFDGFRELVGYNKAAQELVGLVHTENFRLLREAANTLPEGERYPAGYSGVSEADSLVINIAIQAQRLGYQICTLFDGPFDQATRMQGVPIREAAHSFGYRGAQKLQFESAASISGTKYIEKMYVLYKGTPKTRRLIPQLGA